MSRASLKVVPPSSTPEREALAVAILAHAEAERLHRSNREAFEKAEESLYASYAPEAEADKALRVATAEEPGRIAAEFRGDAVKPGLTVEQAEADLSAIRSRRASVRSVRDALEAETSTARHRASWALDKVKAAAAAVVLASPEISALVDTYAAAERRFVSLRGALETLDRAGALPKGSRFAAQPDPGVAMAWAAALDALQTDADAPLPVVG